MARSYRHGNGRVVPRSGGGQFRKTTMTDIGLSACQAEGCGKIFTPDYESARTAGGFVDPRKLRDIGQFCGEHGGAEKADTGLRVQQDVAGLFDKPIGGE